MNRTQEAELIFSDISGDAEGDGGMTNESLGGSVVVESDDGVVEDSVNSDEKFGDDSEGESVVDATDESVGTVVEDSNDDGQTMGPPGVGS